MIDDALRCCPSLILSLHPPLNILVLSARPCPSWGTVPTCDSKLQEQSQRHLVSFLHTMYNQKVSASSDD